MSNSRLGLMRAADLHRTRRMNEPAGDRMQHVGGPKLSSIRRDVLRLVKQGRAGDALHMTRSLVESFPHAPEAWAVASDAEAQVGNLTGAIQLMERASALAPSDPGPLAHLARLHVSARSQRSARALAEQALRLNPRAPSLLDMLGTVLSACGVHEIAVQLFRRATAADPRNPRFLFNLAMELRFQGLADESGEVANRTLQIDPANTEVQLHRSLLHRQTQASNHIAELEALVAAPRSWREEVQLRYALAKEYEDIGDAERSFSHLSRGAALKKAHTVYNVDDDLQAMEKIAAVFTRAAIAGAGPGCKSKQPIFIVGLPRTGTTLLERMLDSHSLVHAGGELQDFPNEVVKAVSAVSGGAKIGRMEFAERSITVDMTALGDAYVRASSPEGLTARHVSDKLPLNFLYCGLIGCALPEARIIHLTREPMDTCYAIFKTLFKDAYPFSYDLTDLARYYAGYRRLMAHWHSVMGDNILDVPYEHLVARPEDSLRRVLSFCDLPYEPGVLAFHKNKRASTTASSLQVRQPLYSTSIASWRPFAKQLEPLAEQLRALGV